MTNNEMADAILEATNGGQDYFIYAYKGALNLRDGKSKNVKSILYNDTKAAVQFYTYNGKMYWKDYGQPATSDFHKGDVFAFAKQLHKLNYFNEACHKIVADLKLNINLEASSPTELITYNNDGNKIFKLLERKNLNFKIAEIEFWRQYGITTSTLSDFNVREIESYGSVRDDGSSYYIKRKPDQMLFAYLSNDKKSAKIYGVNPKEFTWLGDKTPDYVAGLHLFPEYPYCDDFVIIAAGEKDAMSLHSHGYYAICLNSETAELSEETLTHLRNYFQDRILVMYDLDNTGKESANYLAKKNNLRVVSLPEQMMERGLGKDISDYFKVIHNPELSEQHADIISLEKLENLIKDALTDQVLPTEIKEDTTTTPVEIQLSPFTSANEVITESNNTPTFPEDVYLDLPPLLEKAISRFENARDRDVAFASFLTCLSSCFPKLFGYYHEEKIYPNLFNVIVAPASAGKGVMRVGTYLVDPIHDYLKQRTKNNLENYKIQVKEYEKTREENPDMQEPQEPELRRIYIPANSTSAALIDALAKNRGEGLIVETEIDTLNNTQKNDQGNYSDMLRKGYHHERISLKRKTLAEDFEISLPKLSVLISGTPGQLKMLLVSKENGLFSRLWFYFFNAELCWISPFQHQRESHKEYFGKLGQDLLKFYLLMDESDQEIQFSYTKEQVDIFNIELSQWQKELAHLVGDDIVATVRRLGVICFRISMIFSVIRYLYSENIPANIICRDEDFKRSLLMSSVIRKHAVIAFEKFSDSKATWGIKEKIVSFLEALPANFNRTISLEVANSLGIKEKASEKYIQTLIEKGLLKREEHNKYVKISMR